MLSVVQINQNNSIFNSCVIKNFSINSYIFHFVSIDRKFDWQLSAFMHTRRHGVHSGAVPPPKWLLVPPKRKLCPPPSEDCAPKKLTGSGLLECKSRPKLVFAIAFFVVFVDWHRISWHILDEDLLFGRSPVFGRKDRLNLWFRPENPLEF